MNRKTIVFTCILLIMLTPSAALAGDENTIYLKAGNINTDSNSGQSKSESSGIKTSSAPVPVEDSDKYYIVQFSGHVTQEWKKQVANIGIEFYDYIPENAYVLRMNATQINQVKSLEFIQWTGEYLPEYKYEFNIKQILEQESPVKLIVILFEASDREIISDRITSVNGTILSSSDTTLLISIPAERIEELTSIDGICWIEQDCEPVVFSDVAAGIINVQGVHENNGLNGSGQIIAVCDTGLDTGNNDDSMHADIRNRILQIIDYSGDGAEDNTGHGTLVSGILMGNGAMSEGQYSGMAPESTLVFEAIMDDTGSLSGINKANLNVIFQDAYNLGARIHSNSWGYTSELGNYTTVSRQVDQFVWDNPDMLIVYSAGNEANDADNDGVVDKNSITPPATSKNSIAVGASENYRPDKRYVYNFPSYPINQDYVADNTEGMYASSGRGPTDDGRIKPDLIAPGTFIASAKSSLTSSSYSWGVINPYYAYGGGTSFATPIVAGAAAIAREYYSEIGQLDSPSAALIKATLINGAYDISPGQYGEGQYQEITGRPDTTQGWGRVDVGNSLFAAYPEVIAYYDNVPLSDSQSWTHTYEYIDTDYPARATLAWSDYPASLISSKTLYNDLDLSLSGPSTTYYGNGGSDHTNNVEEIENHSMENGEYTITIEGYNIQEGPQPFALVFSFTCDNNEYPAPDSYAESITTTVSTDVVHPLKVEQESIQMKIDDTPVEITAREINDGYSIEYDTNAPYQSGEHEVIVEASTDNGQEFSYSWTFKVNPAITEFGFTTPAVEGVIDEEARTIAVTVPHGTDITSLTPTITHTGTGVSPSSGAAQDFTKPVTYTVTAEDGSAKTYTATVNVLPGTTKAITAFTLINPPTEGVINEASGTITLAVPYATDVTALTPTITHTGVRISPASGAVQDFTNPVTYTVTAEDGSTQVYTVTVNVTASSEKSITSFEFSELSSEGIIDENAKTITLTVPYETDVTELIPTITHTGTNISPASGVAQDFTNPITYTVTAQDSSAQDYTITVNLMAGTTKSITAFRFTEPAVNGVIDENEMTITLTVPEETNVTSLEPIITHTGISISPESGLAQNFTNPINYTVTADDASTKTYTVSVNVDSSDTTSASNIASSGGGGGGGGGGGTSGEDNENIEVKDVSSLFVANDVTVTFEFLKEGNDIQYISYDSLKNAGTISTTIEVLKNKSAYVDSLPSGEVYKNINIWVGKAGYATETNIDEPHIGFRVPVSWIEDNNIDENSIVLNRYESGWNRLATVQTGTDAEYLYFEANTSGFSPFAITGEKKLFSTPDEMDSAKSEIQSGASNSPVNEIPEKTTLHSLSTLMCIIVISFAFFLVKRH